MNEITYVVTEEEHALYLNGELYDVNSSLNIYDLLVMLKLKGIVKSAEQYYIPAEQVKKRESIFPKELKKLKLK